MGANFVSVSMSWFDILNNSLVMRRHFDDDKADKISEIQWDNYP